MLHPPLCPGGRGAVVYIDWCIKAWKGLLSFKELLGQRLTRVSYEEISLIFFNLDGEINTIVKTFGQHFCCQINIVRISSTYLNETERRALPVTLFIIFALNIKVTLFDG